MYGYRVIYKAVNVSKMQEIDDTTYHIYAKDRCLYHNLKEEEFEETWEMLKVMVGLLKTDVQEQDLTYIKLAGKVGAGGPGKIVYKHEWEEDSY